MLSAGVVAEAELGSVRLLHAGCVPLTIAGGLFPEPPPLDAFEPEDVLEPEDGDEEGCDPVLLASMVGVPVSSQVLLPSGTRA